MPGVVAADAGGRHPPAQSSAKNEENLLHDCHRLRRCEMYYASRAARAYGSYYTFRILCIPHIEQRRIGLISVQEEKRSLLVIRIFTNFQTNIIATKYYINPCFRPEAESNVIYIYS